MSIITGVDGVIAGGRQPVWVIDPADVTEAPTAGATTFPLAAVTGGVKIDCLYDMGDVSLTRAASTRERQRACQKVAETIVTGHTIEGSITAIWDQQADTAAEVNAAYSALPEGGQAYVFVAHGHDSEVDPTAETKGDVWRVKVTQVDHTLAANADEDIKFAATLSGDGYWPNVTLSGV